MLVWCVINQMHICLCTSLLKSVLDSVQLCCMSVIMFHYVPRHMLRPVLCNHHAEHQPSQPQCQGQARCGALHLHEQGNQWGRRPTRGAAQGTAFPYKPSFLWLLIMLCLTLSSLKFILSSFVHHLRGWISSPEFWEMSSCL